MTNLQQLKYEDEDGREILADNIDCLAPFTHIADGFYNWTCGRCGVENSDRWYKISGRVVKCRCCQKLNLLVRTDCDNVASLQMRQREFEELTLEVKRLKDIEKLNDDQLLKIKQEVLKLVEDAIRSAEKHYPKISRK